MIEALKERTRENFSVQKLLAHFDIEIEKHVVKKNNRPIWRGRIGKSKELIFAEDFLRRAFRTQANHQEITEPLTGPIWVIMHFYFTTDRYYIKQSKRKEDANGKIRSRKLPDLSNLYELPQDCLQAAGIILDDNLIESHDLSRRLVGENNRLEVFILRY